MGRAAIFAAMRGKVLPSRQTIAAIVHAWSPDVERDLPYWMARRDDCEAEVVGGRRTVQDRRAWVNTAGPGADFGAELRRRRVEAGMSLSQLANVVHYSKGYLSKVENGRLPPTATLARLTDGFLGAGGALIEVEVRGNE
ncbi:helix-turn-helix domain-containing protein [Lentzea sp. NPDC092896]|uniref:helix-turn-helix domain-containing protein n=1 Tax=Lentzea sp. NPDC092896 TaxID=3364127 RepID=UPI0037FB9C78